MRSSTFDSDGLHDRDWPNFYPDQYSHDLLCSDTVPLKNVVIFYKVSWETFSVKVRGLCGKKTTNVKVPLTSVAFFAAEGSTLILAWVAVSHAQTSLPNYV